MRKFLIFQYYFNHQRNWQKGQALTTILFVMVIVFFFFTQSTILYLGNVELANNFSDGSLLLTKAEGYLENAALRFLRDPSYTGESLQDSNISCTMQIVDLGGAKDITTACQKDQWQKKVGVTVSISNGVYTFSKITQRE